MSPRDAIARLVRSAAGRRGPADDYERALASGRLTVGRHTYGRPRIVIHQGDTRSVSIGSYCSISAQVEILVGGEHRTDWTTTFPLRIHFGLEGAETDGHPRSRGDVVVGNDVWLGRGCRILSGVTIGDGAVVGAYALVNHDVPPYAVVAGMPARVLRHRFDPETVEALLALRWWDWPDEEVKAAVDLLSADPAELLRQKGPGSAPPP